MSSVRNSRWFWRSSFLCVFLTLLSIPPAVFAQAPAGKSRPATVPEGYSITPFGYFHPDCVKTLAPGDILHLDQHFIQHANGSFDIAPRCSHPRFSKYGQLVSDSAPTLATEPLPSSTSTQASSTTGSINGWVESAGTNPVGNSSYGRFQAQWTVPPNPTSTDSFLLDFFIGLQSSTDPQGILTILQPVLDWSTAGWQISAWNCCESGTTYVSPYAFVKPGDVLLGSITNNCSVGTLSCSNWNVSIVDQTTKVSEMLSHTSSFGQTFNVAYGGVLEAYDVTNCADFPPNGAISFTAFNLSDYNNKPVTPAWAYAPAPAALSPMCNYDAPVLTPQEVSLQFGKLVVPSPAINVQKTCTTNAGSTTCTNSVAMSDQLYTAAIYYTTNGSTPTTSSTLYHAPMQVLAPETIKAIAVLKGTTSTLAIRSVAPATN